MNTAAEPLRLTVRVDRPPDPLRLRAALDRRLRGEPQPPGSRGADRRGSGRRHLGAEGDAAVALIKGMLLSFSDPLLGLVPTIVAFQYNPTEVTRVLSVQASASGSVTRCAPLPAREQYQLRAEFDATDGLERGGPLTTVLGVAPRLAAIEMLVQPVGSSLLGGLAGSLLGGGGGAEVPVAKLPVVLFSWGPGRLTPVTVTSLTIRETGFDALLNPIHASVDLALTVQRKEELPADEQFARAAADVYQGAREVKAVLQLPQMLELGG